MAFDVPFYKLQVRKLLRDAPDLRKPESVFRLKNWLKAIAAHSMPLIPPGAVGSYSEWASTRHNRIPSPSGAIWWIRTLHQALIQRKRPEEVEGRALHVLSAGEWHKGKAKKTDLPDGHADPRHRNRDEAPGAVILNTGDIFPFHVLIARTTRAAELVCDAAEFSRPAADTAKPFLSTFGLPDDSLRGFNTVASQYGRLDSYQRGIMEFNYLAGLFVQYVPIARDYAADKRLFAPSVFASNLIFVLQRGRDAILDLLPSTERSEPGARLQRAIDAVVRVLDAFASQPISKVYDKKTHGLFDGPWVQCLHDAQRASNEVLGLLSLPRAKGTAQENGPRLVLSNDKSFTVVLDGKQYPLTSDGFQVLEAIVAGKGRYVSVSLKHVKRPDRILMRMQLPLRELIQSKKGTGGGYRIDPRLTDIISP